MTVMTMPMTSLTELQIWDRLLKPKEAALPASVARYFLDLEFGPADVERMHHLAAKAREGTLSPEEDQEIEIYSRMGCFLSILQSKARISLKKVARPKTATR